MIWAYVLMCLIYGTTFLAIRAGDVAGMPPFLFAAIRFTLAGILTLAFLWWRNKGAFPRSSKFYWNLVYIGFFNTTLVFAIVYFYEQFVPSSYAALIGATMPFMVALLGSLTKKQSITGIQISGLTIGFLGVMTVAWPGFHAGLSHWLAATVALVVAQLGAAMGATRSREILANGASPFVVNGLQVLFGGIGLLILAGFTEHAAIQHSHAQWQGLVALIYLTVFGSIVASSIFYWLIKKTNALLPSTWTYVSPVIAIFVGHWWFQEPVSLFTVIGTIFILSGVLLLNLRAFQEFYRNKQAAQRQSEFAAKQV